MALGFILGSVFTFLFMFIPAVLNINERDDYRTQKAKGKFVYGFTTHKETALL